MPTNTLIGFILTGVVLVMFLLWTAHELRRVKEPEEQPSDVDDGPRS